MAVAGRCWKIEDHRAGGADGFDITSPGTEGCRLALALDAPPKAPVRRPSNGEAIRSVNFISLVQDHCTNGFIGATAWKRCMVHGCQRMKNARNYRSRSCRPDGVRV